MPSPREKALKALAVYLRRGYEASEAWKFRGTDAFLNVMTERDAAFHNFRCFEDQARRATPEDGDVAEDPEALRLMALVAQQNAALTSLVAAALQDVESKLCRTNAARNAARAYHSGTQPPARLVRQS